jgi:hypothetical protein
MPDQQPSSADLRKLIEQWVAAHLGLPGTVALAALFAVGAIWWNWEKIRKLPGIEGLLNRGARRPPPVLPLPRSSPGRFAVAVAHLENDQNAEQERLLVEALAEIGTIQVLRFDRVIAPQRDDLEEAIKAGHEQGRALIAESGADVLIWGAVLRSGQKTIPKLHWTTARGLPLENRARRYQLTEELDFPEIFHTDLTDILDVLVLTTRDYISPDEAYTRGPLPEFIERVDKLLVAESPKWPQATRSSLLFAFADLCSVYGIKDWKNDEWLRKAQVAYRAGLPKPAEDWIPRGYLNALFNFARTHFYRGIHRPDRTQLEDAVPLYCRVVYLSSGAGVASNYAPLPTTWRRHLLQVMVFYPLDSWTYFFANAELGHVLKRLGEADSGTERLEEALAAYTTAKYEMDVAIR